MLRERTWLFPSTPCSSTWSQLVPLYSVSNGKAHKCRRHIRPPHHLAPLYSCRTPRWRVHWCRKTTAHSPEPSFLRQTAPQQDESQLSSALPTTRRPVLDPSSIAYKCVRWPFLDAWSSRTRRNSAVAAMSKRRINLTCCIYVLV